MTPPWENEGSILLKLRLLMSTTLIQIGKSYFPKTQSSSFSTYLLGSIYWNLGQIGPKFSYQQ